MTTKIRDLLPQQPGSDIDRLLRCLDDDGPVVVWVCGNASGGRRDLLSGFQQAVAARDAHAVRLDCRTVEPTIAGLLAALGEILDDAPLTLEGAAEALSRRAGRVVLIFDNYEVFRLADSWLRRDFFPALDATARVVLASVEPPTAGWLSATEWHNLFDAISLDSNDDDDPDELLRRFREAAPDDRLQQSVEAMSVVRRVTEPMLRALVPGDDTADRYEALSALPFVESRRDGLALSDTMRHAVADRLKAADLDRYRNYQKAAWKLLRQQLRDSARADLWRCTADIIYLIENPVIREAFFPSEYARYSVEPATAPDFEAILDITAQHEPDAAVATMRLWADNLPSAFHVIRDAAGSIAGFSCIALPADLDSDWMQSDPVARQWQHHVNLKGRSVQPPSLFLRRWLSGDDGEGPSAVQGAAWVDVNRTYLELRPELRRVYLVLQDLGPYAAAATQLGFKVLDDMAVDIGGQTCHSAMLDFGPGSVDGWICNLLAAELGVAEEQLLDAGARELVIGERRIPLTPLEFDLVAMLESRSGEAVSRNELLTKVWGHNYDGGSNVVDAVVRGLRKKCGDDASLLETVRGVGYRLRA